MAEEYRVLSATPHIAGHPPERVCEHNSLDEWLADPARMPARGEASLVLEFTRGPVRVTSVDVCNAGSALVEVLVFNAPQPQQQPRLSVLLPVKILLSPPECKGRVNRNRTVRFEAKDFTAEPARQSWERVKIVLRNPFVDNEPFGLCFVRFNASSSSSSSVPAPLPPVEKKKPAAAASFVAVPPVEEPMHAAAAAAEPSVALETPRMSDAARVALRSPVKPLRPPKPTAPAAAAPAEHSANTTADLPPPDLPTEPMLPRVGAADSPRKARDSSSSSAAAAAAGDEQRVFHGVVLSISGIPNPERSELRSIALGLGGRYEDDAQHATHLICAFRDSPKYFIAKEHGGLIVTKQWSRLAVELCKRLGGEAVNADAMQCYAGLPIATNKATDAERAGVPHHLLGFSDPLAAPDAQLNVHRWVARADAAIADIAARGSLPVVVGGTHYYVEALVWRRLVGCETHAPPPVFAADVPTAELYAQLQAADPVMASRVCESDRRKIARSLQVHAQTGRRHSELLAEQRTAPAELRYDALFLWVDCDDWDALSVWLDARIDEMLARGLLAEIAEFKAAATSAGQTSFERGIHQAIGVREFWPICGTGAAEEEDPAALAAATDAMKRNTRKYARQQLYDCDKVKCRLPESDYALDDGLQASDDDTSAAAVAAAASPKKKSARSVATDKSGRKRRRKKKGADGDEPDSEYESSGPDEYDLADSFIDNRPASEIDEGSAGTSTDSSRSSTADEGDTEMRELLREGRRFVHDGGGGGHLRRHRAAAPDFRRVKLPEDFNTDDEDDEDFTGTDARMAAGDEAEAERKWLQEHAGDVRIPAQPEQRHREPPPRRHSPPHPHPPAVAAAAASAKAARPPERKPVTSAPAPKPKAPARMDDGYETEPMEDAELLDSLSNVVPRSDAESAVKERRKSRKQGQAPVQVAAAVVKPKVDKTGRLLGKDGPIRKLPEFLSGVGALIFGEMDAARRRQLVRIIVAFGGKALEAMTEETTHVVTELPWDTALQDAQETHPGLSIVRPSWLEACYEQRKQIPAVGHFVHA